MREVSLLDRAFDEADKCLRILTEAMKTLTVHRERMKSVADNSWATATGLADVLVRNAGLSFRQARGIVAKVVREAVSDGLAPADVTSAYIDGVCSKAGMPALSLDHEMIRSALEPERFVASRTSRGGTCHEEVARMLESERQRLTVGVSDQEKKLARLDEANIKLRAAIAPIVANMGGSG